MSWSAPVLFRKNPRRAVWLMVANVTLAGALVLVSLMSVNLVMGELEALLGIGREQAVWIGKSFLIVTALMPPLATRMARLFGYKRTLFTALLIFLLGSILSILAQTFPQMILARSVCGIGGGSILSIALGVVIRRVPENLRDRVAAIHSALVFGLGLAGGLLLGGFFDSPRALFATNACLAALQLALVAILHPGTKPVSVRPFDGLGYLSLATFFVCLLFGIALSWTALPIAVGALAIYIWSYLRTEAPLFDLRLFKNPSFTIGAIGLVLVGIMVFGVTMTDVFLLQEVYHYSQLKTGALLSVVGFIYLFIGGFARRHGALVGLALVAGSSLVAQWLKTGSPEWFILLPILLRACGMALTIGPLTASALSHFSEEWSHKGAEMILFLRMMGGAFGMAIVALLMQLSGAAPLPALLFALQILGWATLALFIAASVRLLVWKT